MWTNHRSTRPSAEQSVTDNSSPSRPLSPLGPSGAVLATAPALQLAYPLAASPRRNICGEVASINRLTAYRIAQEAFQIDAHDDDDTDLDCPANGQ
jgi:hypothetical protein